MTAVRGFTFRSMRTNDKVINALLTARGMLDAAQDVGEEIRRDVISTTSSSSTLKPYGRKMVVGPTENGYRVGTTWGPAVPVEYGTASTPAHAILRNAAAKYGARPT